MPCRSKAEQAAAARRHYMNNRDKIIARARAFSLKQRDVLRCYIDDYLATHHCVDCGESDPVVLEFDHDRTKPKAFNIGEAPAKGISIKTLSSEIEKCEVRCANCHRRKTYAEQQEKVRTARGGDSLPLFER